MWSGRRWQSAACARQWHTIGQERPRRRRPDRPLSQGRNSEGNRNADAGGTTEEDGTFSLTSYEPGDGAPIGDYIVTVVWREEIPEGKSLDTFNPKDRLNGRYASPDKSTLNISVPEGGGKLPPIEIP